MIDVALATCAAMPEPDGDREVLLEALMNAGIKAEWLAWDDPKADFKQARITVLRSTWNYIHHREAFIAWADTLGFRLCNPPSIVRWNTHKRYLRELSEVGRIPTVPTVLLPQAVNAKLSDVLKAKHWFSAVAKPAIGAGSFCTRRISSSDEDSRWLDEQLKERDMLLQPYMANVESSGERALVYIEGEVTHAVRKSPRFSDGSERVELCEIGDDERALAHRAMSWVMREVPGGGLLYGRIDMVRDTDGSPRIMELELTEPSLFFKENPAALANFVQGIKRRLEMVR